MSGRVVAIIPARGGSKGIPKKNLMDFCGAPLLSWSVRQACQATTVDTVYVSSDDPEILRVTEAEGGRPIVRPAELATDTATSESALRHALDEIEATSGGVRLVVFLQATSPLRESADIDGAVRKLVADEADSLMSVARLEDFFLWVEREGVYETVNFDNLSRKRRQDFKPQLLETGSIYVFKPWVLREHNVRLAGRISVFEMPFWKWYEIDSHEAREVAEWYFRSRLLAAQAPQPSSGDVDLVVYDFDGVMTNNRVFTFQDGTEALLVNRSDGLGVSMLKRAGVPQLILSTETNSVVGARAAKLGIPAVQGAADKARELAAHCARQGVRLERVVYVGNDLNDLEAMRLVGWPVAPCDASGVVKQASRIVLRSPGGEGVALELATIILRGGRDTQPAEQR